MSVIHVHPEDLFDRELRGQLTPEERQRLERHLAVCDACRLERQLRDDFARELTPATQALDRLVVDALQASHGTGERPELPVGPAPASPRRWRYGLVAAALVAVFVGGVAAAQAGLGAGVLRVAMHQLQGVLGREPRPARAKPAAAPRTQTRVSLRASPRPSLGSAPTSASSSGAEPAARAGSRAVAHRRTQGTDVTAAALFERANLARRRGRLVQASALYQGLRARFPHSSEALLSVALSARMQLDAGASEAALDGFRRYLRSNHRVLREQALAGVAIALLRLDRPAEADAAFAALLRAYPDSAYAQLARGHGTEAP